MCYNGYEIEINLFRYGRFKVGRCSCKNIGSSHLKHYNFHEHLQQMINIFLKCLWKVLEFICGGFEKNHFVALCEVILSSNPETKSIIHHQSFSGSNKHISWSRDGRWQWWLSLWAWWGPWCIGTCMYYMHGSIILLLLPSPLDKISPCVLGMGNFASSLVPGLGGGDNWSI